MNKRILICLLVLVAVVGTAIGVRAEEEQRITVFRDLAWGDPVERLGECVELPGGDQFLRMYTKSSELTALGSVEISTIIYYFFRDQLCSIRVGTLDAKSTLAMLKAKYGSPHQSDEILQSEAKWWVGDTFVYYESDLVESKPYFMLMSTKLANEYNRLKDEQSKKDADSW